MEGQLDATINEGGSPVFFFFLFSEFLFFPIPLFVLLLLSLDHLWPFTLKLTLSEKKFKIKYRVESEPRSKTAHFSCSRTSNPEQYFSFG